MNLLEALPLINRRSKKIRQVISDTWVDRFSIQEPNVNLFCWKRAPNPTISSYLNELIVKDIPPISLKVNSNDLQDQLNRARATWEKQYTSAGDSFWIDVFGLTNDFLTFSNEKSGWLHLKVIEDDACRKFHTDGYALRLFTTYLGRGTEWLPEKAVNRSALGRSNALIVRDPEQIQQMDAFEVGILKGELPNQQNAINGIVHRSPEIAYAGEKRVILRVDLTN
jgi:hypothetical protein